VLVEDIRPGSLRSNPDFLMVVATKLFFSASDGATGAELWGLQLP